MKKLIIRYGIDNYLLSWQVRPTQRLKKQRYGKEIKIKKGKTIKIVA